MAEGKTDRFVNHSPAIVRELLYHDMARAERELGPLLKFMDATIVEEADLVIHVRQVEKDPPNESKSTVDMHHHDESEVYCFLGDLKAEVTLGEEKHLVSAPAAVFIPAGMDHRIRYISGPGYMIGVVRSPKYF